MSDLKHMTPDQLRQQIQSLSTARENLKTNWEAKERKIEELQQEIDDLRKKFHDWGQRETWARIYLARKTNE